MSQFTLVDLPNGTWAVHWPELEPIYWAIAVSKKRLLQVAAGMGCWRVGVGMVDKKEELYIEWIDLIQYNDSLLEDLERHLLQRGELRGLVFEEECHAREFADYLSKHIVWKALNENY